MIPVPATSEAAWRKKSAVNPTTWFTAESEGIPRPAQFSAPQGRETERQGEFLSWRGRRDLNPRAGFIQPTPLAGEPLRPLGYFRRSGFTFKKLAERVGFEPTGTCAPPVFKTGSFNHSDISPFRRRRLLNTPYSIAYPPPVCQQVFAHTRREKQGAPPDPCFYGRPAGENAPPRRPSGPLIWRRPLSL